jgi:hypothetical protein
MAEQAIHSMDSFYIEQFHHTWHSFDWWDIKKGVDDRTHPPYIIYKIYND